MSIVISGVNNNDKITASDGTIDLLSGVTYNSEITVPSLKLGSNIQLGNAGIITATSFAGNISGNITGTTGTFGDFVNIGSNIQLGNAGVVTATTFVGNVTGNVNNTGNLLLQIGGGEKVRITSTGRVGINSTNPSAPLEIYTAASAAWKFRIDTTVSDGVGFYQRANGDFEMVLRDASNNVNYIAGTSGALQFATSGSEQLRIDSNGRLLSGYTAALNKFHGPGSTTNRNPHLQISGTNVNSASMSLTSWDNNVNGYYGPALYLAKSGSTTIGGNGRVANLNSILGSIIFSGDDGTDFVKGAMIQAAVDTSTGDNDMPSRLMFLTTGDGTQQPTERVRITSGGTTRIGDSTAYSSLGDSDYQCVIHPNRSNSSKAALGLHIKQTGGQGGGSSAASICLKIDNTANYNNASHMYGIFTDVNQQYVQPTTGCHVETQGTYSETIVFDGKLEKGVNAATNGITYKSNIVQTGTELGATYHMRCFNNNSERLRITLGGNIQNTNNSYGQISDVKFKENIVDANSQWDDIKAIKVRNFNFKSSTGFETHKQIGVIAQELETVSAGLIDITNDTELNESTGEGTVTGTTKYVKYSILYMKSVKALQEAMTRIETLEAKVATLEGS